MRPLPILLTTLLAINALIPETQAQSKPTPTATLATSTKSIDQLVAKINADIKAKKVSVQSFKGSLDERVQIQVEKDPNLGPQFAVVRRGAELVAVSYDEGHENLDFYYTHYFRSDGSLAMLEMRVGEGAAPPDSWMVFYFDPAGKKIGEKATEKQGRKLKTRIVKVWDRELLAEHLHFMSVSQLSAYLDRHWRNN